MDATTSPVTIPRPLQQGVPMMKVSSKKHKRFIFRLDPDLGQIEWQSKKLRIVPLRNIQEIRTGSDTSYYREQFQLSAEYEDRWLTIIYTQDGTYKTLHLIAMSQDVLDMWEITLRQFHSLRQELSNSLGNGELRQAVWEKQYWGGSEEEEPRLSFADVEKMCRRLNIHTNSEDLRRLFERADAQATGTLDFQEFRVFVKFLKSRPELESLYGKIRHRGGGVMDLSSFDKFMREKQKSSLGSKGIAELFYRYSEDSEDNNRTMSLEMFSSFLMSPDNAAFKDHHGRIWQDMTRPLSDYYISSSHNTYLVGHQLVGSSTVEGYVRALLHGCRSVEVDIFDGDPIREPMIYHGKTLTTKVPLRNVCYTIAKYGFIASPYPIIISAEMYCSVAGQDAVADILEKTFGDKLVAAPISGDGAFLVRLPSPEALKGRILFKTKNLDFFFHDSGTDSEREGSSTTDLSSTSDSEAAHEFRHAINTVERDETVRDLRDELRKAGSTVLKRVRGVANSQPIPIARSPAHSTSLPISISTSPARYGGFSIPHSYSEGPSVLSSSPSLLSASPSMMSANQARQQFGTSPVSDSPQALKTKPRMSKGLLKLLVYTMGVKYRGINKKEVYAPEHMFSLSESAAKRIFRSSVSQGITDGMLDMVKHCRTHLVRLYPKATRVSSSNFEPHRYWVAGIQLVALNWQTFDLGRMINHAMFQRNGRAGYVLKPPPLLNNHPSNKELMFKRTQHYFDVTIISAQQLPRPRDASGQELPDSVAVDPYVEVSVHVPNWPSTETVKPTPLLRRPSLSSRPSGSSTSNLSPKIAVNRTGVVKNNGFNPVWDEKLRIPFDCVGDMLDLVFVRFVVRQGGKGDGEPIAACCASLGSLAHGYRHLTLYDMQLSEYLFTTLFVRINITDG